MRGRVALASAAVLGIVTGTVVTGATTTPAAADDYVCSSVDDETDSTDTGRSSAPLTQLDIGRARQVVERLAPRGGPPVRVAVLDSGVYGEVGDNPQLTIGARTTDITGHSEVTFYHGTAVAGLIAGHARSDGKPVGIAPHAEIVDVRVYDDEDGEDGARRVTASALVDGLEWVAQHAADLNIKVANVSLAVRRSDDLSAAVRAVRRAGVVVVAASGNRPSEGSEFDPDFPDADDEAGIRSEDAADVIFPAGLPGVVAVNSTADGDEGTPLSQWVLKNSRTDVAVPTAGAVTYGLNGTACLVDSVATSWAAAEVSGVLALLWERFPGDNEKQIVARLLNTANGTTDDPTPLTGVGVVQPYAALTRPLDPSSDGTVERATTHQDPEVRATAPEPEPDLLATTRDDAVWWGLIGGGTLVVALLLRPVLSRRRR